MFILWLKKILNKIPFIKKIVLICFYFIVNFKNNFIMFKYYFYNYFLSYYPSYHIRHWYLKYILHIKLQDRCFVHLGCYFYGSNIEIGKGSVIGRHCQLCGDIKIGNNCSITAYSFLQSISHDKNSPTFECCSSKIIIQDYVWLGAYSMVLCGGGGLSKNMRTPTSIIIGKGAILGANSTTTKNIPAFKVYAGTPAKEIGIRNEEACVYDLDYHPAWN